MEAAGLADVAVAARHESGPRGIWVQVRSGWGPDHIRGPEIMSEVAATKCGFPWLQILEAANT